MISDNQKTYYIIYIGDYKHDTQLLGAGAAADALTNDVSGVDDIVDDSLVDIGAGHRARTIEGSHAGLGDDGALSHEDDVLAAEHLLHLHRKHGLDLTVVGTLHEGNLNDDRLLALRNLKLVAGDNAKTTELLLHVSGGLGLDVVHGKSNSALSQVGVLLAAEDGTKLVLHRWVLSKIKRADQQKQTTKKQKINKQKKGQRKKKIEK